MLNLNEFLNILQIKPADLGIAQLDHEIERLKLLQLSEESAKHRDQFVQSLENLRRNIYQGFVQLLSPFCKYKILPNGNVHVLSYSGSSHDIKAKALESSITKVIGDTVKTLEKLTYTKENAEQEYNYLASYGKKYEALCRQHPRFKSFWVGIASVALSGIGFIVGAGVGAVCGFLKGLKYCLVGSLFTTPYYAVKGAIVGAMEANDLGKQLAGEPPYNTTLRSLLFQGPAIESAAVKVTQSSAAFFQGLKTATIKPEENSYSSSITPNQTTFSSTTEATNTPSAPPEERLYPSLDEYKPTVPGYSR